MGTKIAMISALVVAAMLGAWSFERQAKIERGQKAFRRLGCVACHFSGGAPSLTGVTDRYDQKTLTRFILNPEDVYRERGKRPLNAGFYPMPNPHASPRDASDIVAYFESIK